MSETWVTSAEAAQILSEKAGRPISDAYVRLLAKKDKIRIKQIDARTKLYHRGDCEGYTVHALEGQRVEQRVRDRRSGRPPGRPRKQITEQGE
ncbi:MAG TPA: hypothetical protein VFN23_18490 [Ktedonobacteraceae bacterium]|nr:hypothetical protein [Ktedonobacteraceae bacterium]